MFSCQPKIFILDMKKNILHTTLLTVCLLITPILFIGCDKKQETSISNTSEIKIGNKASNVVNAKIGDYILDEQGRKYKKITDEAFNVVTGIGTADIWERIDPLDTTRWYTPTLTSKTFHDSPTSFNSLYRLPGENVPTF